MFHLASPSSSSHHPSLVTGQRGEVNQQAWLASFSPTGDCQLVASPSVSSPHLTFCTADLVLTP